MIGARIELDGKVTEREGQQFLSGRGLNSDAFTEIHRIEPHGFMSNPIKGSIGLGVSPNGNPDEMYILGGEHPEKRPKGLAGGAAAIYDAHGNIMKMVMGDGVVVDVAGNSITFNKGGVSVVIDGTGLHVNGGGIWNDGIPVDKTHIHGGVVPGGGTTSVPVG